MIETFRVLFFILRILYFFDIENFNIEKNH